jgi:hypothetical protein
VKGSCRRFRATPFAADGRRAAQPLRPLEALVLKIHEIAKAASIKGRRRKPSGESGPADQHAGLVVERTSSLVSSAIFCRYPIETS